jgi:hypothetical protein
MQPFPQNMLSKFVFVHDYKYYIGCYHSLPALLPLWIANLSINLENLGAPELVRIEALKVRVFYELFF